MLNKADLLERTYIGLVGKLHLQMLLKLGTQRLNFVDLSLVVSRDLQELLAILLQSYGKV